jgi:hypothetical protein
VTVTAVTFLVLGGFFALAVLLAFVPLTPGMNVQGKPSPGYSAFSGTAQNPTAEAATATQIAIALALAVVFSVVGLGLWRLRPWARIATMAMPGAMVAVLILTNMVQPFSGGVLVLLVVWAALAVYLLSGNVARAFRGRGREGASLQVQ